MTSDKLHSENTGPLLWRIGQLGPQDMAEVAALERAVFSHPWTREQFRRGMATGAVFVIGARLGGELGGYCSHYVVHDEADIVNIAVHPRHRNRGLGGEILAAVLHSLRKRGIKSVSLEVRRSNAPARRLYARAGFVQVGVRPRYYPDTGEDALVLSRTLEPTTTAKESP
jgi:ribosomal-protein-alanine N-acetyltransferase